MKKSDPEKWSDFNLGRPLFYTPGVEEYDRRMARALQLSIRNAEIIVDYGCGDGLWLEYLARNNPARSFIGVEWNEKLFSYAEMNRGLGLKNVKLVRADMSEPEGIHGCDFFFCFGGIEHFSVSEEVLKKWVDKLSPGGGCIITAPNILSEDWLRTRCGIDPETVRGKDKIATDSYGYEEIWSPSYFLGMVMNAGLEVLEYRWLDELPDRAHYVRALRR